MTIPRDRRERETCQQIGETCICFNLRKTARTVTQFFDEALRASGLRSTQFALLVILRLNAPCTISHLATPAGMNRTTLSRNLKVLSGRGLVDIRPGEDRRRRFVDLNDVGRTMLVTTIPVWRQAQERVVERLGPQPAAQLLTGLAQAEQRIRT